MKISLALGPRQNLSRQTAWGCFTTNLAVPGTGSLAAGRPVGYVQLALTTIGFGLTTVFGFPFIAWCLAHWDLMFGSERDVVAVFSATWHLLRWALLGIAMFLFAWLWALLTSYQILRSARLANSGDVPPRLS
jgi:hypothetical protein